jgi:hypothetical protein
MAKKKEVVIEATGDDMVEVKLTDKHPMFNKKLKKQYTFMVCQKLADKGVKSGHFKLA